MKFLIVDDHGLFRVGLRTLLSSFSDDAEVFEAADIERASVIAKAAGDIRMFILDLNLLGEPVLGRVDRLRDLCPSARFVVLSASEASDDVLDVLSKGLHGYISKAQSDEEILAAFRYILDGGLYVPPFLAEAAGRKCRHPSHPSHPSGGFVASEHNEEGLTKRQTEVLELVAHGCSNKEIARRLKISEMTVKVHVAAIMRVLNVQNRTMAALEAPAWLKLSRAEISEGR
ncbi:LuxR C-terminal-related transcriptional regulator [Consotaella salsifontis]|uniref:Two component transcriptional regulator, LuxR family n=1 Tax=Consotaella salsifontis TaxID=1365950 RepID=A0A1T4SY78_9HYPH|nr:response regulator transcription factor [Consotaella salsifontis]SKA32861.1 two component transcriptional regulator, LuxR family [Consotaella salsifontis]